MPLRALHASLLLLVVQREQGRMDMPFAAQGDVAADARSAGRLDEME
jgi:hypothetical protein